MLHQPTVPSRWFSALLPVFLGLAACGPANAQQLSWAKQTLASDGYCIPSAVATFADGSSLDVGNFLGTATFGPGEAGQVIASAPAVTAVGVWQEGFLAKRAPDGTLLWVRFLRVDASHPNLQGTSELTKLTDVATTSDGGFVLTGWLFAPTTFGVGESQQTTLLPIGDIENGPLYYTLFLARYDANGQLIWARRDGPGVTAYSSRLAVADGDAIYVTGAFFEATSLGIGDPNETVLSDGTSDARMFVARYGANGDLEWARMIRNGPAEGRDVAALPDGSCVVSGWTWHDGNPGSSPVAGSGEANETPLDSLASYEAMFLARYLADGSLAWVRQGLQSASPGFAADSRADEIESFVDGSFAISGSFWGELTLGVGELHQATLQSDPLLDEPDPYVARYESDGSLRWAKRIEANGASPRERGLTTRVDGSLLLVGNAYDAVVFEPGTPAAVVVPAGIFLAGYGEGGDLLWAKGQPGGASAIASFGDSSFVIAGNVDPAQSTMGAGEPNQTTLSPSQGALLARFRGESTQLTALTDSNGPNPVAVAPTNSAENGASGVEIEFASVSASGTTTVTALTIPPAEPLPSSYQLAGGTAYYEIDTTAAFSAPVQICLLYDENGIADESELRLLHYEAAQWVDITSELDTEGNRICGVTSSFSPFVLVVPAPPPPVAISAAQLVLSSFGGTTTIFVETDGGWPTLTASAGVLQGALLDLGDGRHFTQVFQATCGAPGATLTASVGSASASLFLRFVGIDPAQSLITADPATIYLGGNTLVTVLLRDDQGQPVSGFGEVQILTDLGQWSGDPVEVATGTIQRTFVGSAVGTAQVTVTVDGLRLDGTAAVSVLDTSYGAVFGVDALQNGIPYVSIQEAVNRASADELQAIYVTPGSYDETVKFSGVESLVLEALSGVSPVELRGLRLERCRDLRVRGFLITPRLAASSGVTLAGGANGNEAIVLEGLRVLGSSGQSDGIQVGPQNGTISILACEIVGAAGDGIALAQGGPHLISDCTISACGRTGVFVDKAATATVRFSAVQDNGRAGDAKRGYGVLRQRAPGSGDPTSITLLGNQISGNRGLVVAGRSDAELGNYDQILDASDG